MQEIGPWHGKETQATAMNERGHVVGRFDADGLAMPFFYRNGKVRPVALPPGYVSGSPLSINDRGDFLVDAGNGLGFDQFLYSGGGYSQIEIPPPFSDGSVLSLTNDGRMFGLYLGQYNVVSYVFDGVNAYELSKCLRKGSGVYDIQEVAGVDSRGRILANAFHLSFRRRVVVVLTPAGSM